MFHYRVVGDASGYLLQRRLPFCDWQWRWSDGTFDNCGLAEKLAIRKRLVAGASVVLCQLLCGWLLISLHESQGWTFDRLYLLAPLPLAVWAWVLEENINGAGLTLGETVSLLTGQALTSLEGKYAEAEEDCCSKLNESPIISFSWSEPCEVQSFDCGVTVTLLEPEPPPPEPPPAPPEVIVNRIQLTRPKRRLLSWPRRGDAKDECTETI